MDKSLKRILLAEDDDRDAELTLTALEEYRLANRVDRVENGIELLDYLRCENGYAHRNTGTPAVVLLDLKMPKMNGMEALKAIREDHNLHCTPVVILTSSKEEKDLVASYELGVNAYVVKPVDFQQFIEAIKEVGGFWGIYNEPPPDKHE